MKRVLFLVTELQQPVGGLYRFTVEYLQAWRELLNSRKTTFEPIVFSVKDPLVPTGDLRPSLDIPPFEGMRIFEANRGGGKAYFLESKLSPKEKNALHKHLWDYYGIPSHKASAWDYYSLLSAFWKNMVPVAEFLDKQKKIRCVDCQDWLAFPAGFLIKEKLGAPLLCRFHSCEFGRSMGSPDFSAPPTNIEAAALMEADFVQSVSVTEAKFDLYHLLPLKKEIARRVARNRRPGFLEEQMHKDKHYEQFLLLEPEDLNLVGQNAAGIANGIILDSWKTVDRKTVKDGRKMLERLLSGKKKYALFVGRTETRKGVGTLIDAFSYLKRQDAGLILASSFSEESKALYERKIRDLGLEGRAVIHNGWVEENVKKGLFCAADVIALPSLYEPFGLVTLEALAADLACEKNGLTGPTVVVGDTGGMREVIKNGVNGFKAPMLEALFQLNPEYLSRILEMAFENDALRKRISKEGARRVESRFFNWKYIARKIFSLYDLTRENSVFYGRIRGEQMDVVEHFGGNAGKVWLALKDSKPMSLREVREKTRLSSEEAMAGLGWLASERKVYEISEGKGVKYGLSE